MKNLFLLLLIFFIGVSCANEVRLNRVHGVKGEFYPILLEEGIKFHINAPEATLVTIAGSFNGWNPYATELEKNKDGVWSIILPLRAGTRYYYKYLIDGFWLADPDNPNTVPDGYGGVNSEIFFPVE
jgi:1,4-alpha-glucan branching enzyme